MKKILSVLLVLAMVCAGTAALADAPYTPGTYTVSVDGHNGEICLAVEMTADAIASIKVLSHSETTGLGDVAMDKVIAAIVAANNADVDAVASATVSSNAVIKGVKIALERAAKGEVDQPEEKAPAAQEMTFADQCKEAGVDFIYEDPNAAIYDFATTDASVDVKTSASGKAKYVDETDGPCIRTPLDLAARSAVKVKFYYWIAAGNGASTNAAAALLAYTSCAVMAETATYRNLLAGSPIMISYYEYNPYSEKKIGIGARNAGARVKCELDAERSTLTTVPAEGEKAQTLTVAEYLAMDEAARAAITIKYIKMVAKVVELYSIG